MDMEEVYLRLIKGNKNASRARTRGNLGITVGDKVARGCARQITVTITVAGARGELTT